MFRQNSLKQTLLICWIAYAAIYFGRVNLSVALPELGTLLHMGKAQIGLIGSVFFWVYGIGQMINGHWGDRVSVRHYIFLGLLGTAVANLLFGFSTTFWWLVVLWGLNGLAQSMLWAPMIRLVGEWTPPEKQTKAVTLVSTSAVGGYLLAWGLSGQMLVYASLPWVFWTPAIFLASVGVLWFVIIRNQPLGGSRHAPVESQAVTTRAPLSKVVLSGGLPLVILACMAQGIVKDGITLWAPSFFLEAHHLDITHAAGFLLLIPLANLGGTLASGWVNQRLGQRELLTSALFFGASLAFLVGLVTLGPLGPAVSAAFLALTSAGLFGANTMLLGLVPLRFASQGRVSTVAGLLDFSAYLASGSAAFLTGLLIDSLGWQGVFLFWIVALLVPGGGLVLQERFQARRESRVP